MSTIEWVSGAKAAGLLHRTRPILVLGLATALSVGTLAILASTVGRGR